MVLRIQVGRDSSVGTATRYGLDGSVFESWWGRDLPYPFSPARGPSSHLHNASRLSFTGGKAAELWRFPPTPPGAEFKERVQLYPYFPLGLSWSVIGGTLPFIQRPKRFQSAYKIRSVIEMRPHRPESSRGFMQFHLGPTDVAVSNDVAVRNVTQPTLAPSGQIQDFIEKAQG